MKKRGIGPFVMGNTNGPIAARIHLAESATQNDTPPRRLRDLGPVAARETLKLFVGLRRLPRARVPRLRVNSMAQTSIAAH